MHLAYDAILTSSTVVYAEEGCTLYLFDTQNDRLLRYFVFQGPAMNGTNLAPSASWARKAPNPITST